MHSSKRTIALFGATGGTGLSILKNCLSAGHTVRVLARTPSKLSSLSAQHANLHIVQGDISDVAAITTTLRSPDTPQGQGRAVDVVISAIGMALEMKRLSFTSTNPHVCESATANILSALSALSADPATIDPLLVLLSTTGISSKSRDIPLLMLPLYHWVLPVPHADKKALESLAIRSGRRWVLVRPSFLMNGEARGLGAVRTGVEVPGERKGEGEDHAVGYTIRREDVALWIYEACVEGDGRRWEGKCVSLTY
ncbi:Flavin reductase (NADPH) [Hyphodiscus hymeniophilus]|uniref:Flavin reductase (NADPH) n=1 Tax=Hyphodiscus hymeniophilus TaxID=353542 RepID=A0A9P6VRP7_9HELO|nr:Flavin reductase (NADPH) [Hyphodiscus hymeniophilus]